MKKSYDVVIPVGRKDCLLVKHTITQLRRHLIDMDTIYVITRAEHAAFFSDSFRCKQGIVLIDEDAVMPGLTFNVVRKICQAHFDPSILNYGWYFQQFLKMAFACNPLCGERYLIWDADTLPLRSLSFIEEGQMLLTPKTEYHLPYFRTLQKLLGIEKVVPYSFIAEHLLVKSSVMQELIQLIGQSPVQGDRWFEKIVYATEPTEPNAFSEFETYGTYCWINYPGLYKTRELATYRLAGERFGKRITSRVLRVLSRDYDTASFEYFSVPKKRIRRAYNRWEQRIIRWRLLLNRILVSHREVVFLQGGLGNQMFQYAFFLHRQALGKHVHCDRYYLRRGNQHNGFELERVFGIHVNHCHNPHRHVKWWKRGGLSVSFVNEEDRAFVSSALSACPAARLTLYLGYWQTEDFFADLTPQVHQAFRFDFSRLNPINVDWLKRIQLVESVSIHVRLGDYLQGDNKRIFGNICTPDYYRKAIQYILSKHPDACFFVFSNEMEEAQAILSLPNAVFITGNSGQDAWQDMCLMSQCKHNIIANSTFSWWGAWLNEHPDKEVVSPSRFLNAPTPFSIIPKRWTCFDGYL